MMLAALDGEAGVAEIVERDDALINANVTGPAMYFAPFRRVAAAPPRGDAPRARPRPRRRRRRGSRLAASPGARSRGRGDRQLARRREVCRRRGVRDARLFDFADVDESLGAFDTIVMLGNNFGVFGSPAKAKRLLRRPPRTDRRR